MKRLVVGFILSLAPACATTPVPEHHPSAAVYDDRATKDLAAARQQEQASHALARRRDGVAGVRGGCSPGEVCWTEEGPPTDEHLQEAGRLRHEALRDRKISKELLATEARSCVGVSLVDRELSPFVHLRDISSVRPLYREPPPRNSASHPRGAVVTFRPIPGMTVDQLRQIVECHLARDNALGTELPDVSIGLMATPGTQVSVAQTADGFAVSLWSDDPVGAQELLRKANLLAPQEGVPTTAR